MEYPAEPPQRTEEPEHSFWFKTAESLPETLMDYNNLLQQREALKHHHVLLGTHRSTPPEKYPAVAAPLHSFSA